MLLCMSFESRIKTFKPKTYLDRKDITLIRPLIYVEEKTILKHNPKLRENLLSALRNNDIWSDKLL